MDLEIHGNESGWQQVPGACQMVLDCTEMMEGAHRWLHSESNPTSMSRICCHGEGFLLQSGFIQPWKVILHVLQASAYGVKICPTTCHWFYSWTNEEPSNVGKEPNFTISCLHHCPLPLRYPESLFLASPQLRHFTWGLLNRPTEIIKTILSLHFWHHKIMLVFGKVLCLG